MSNMQISIRFRWESGVNDFTMPLLYVLVNDLFNKIL